MKNTKIIIMITVTSERGRRIPLGKRSEIRSYVFNYLLVVFFSVSSYIFETVQKHEYWKEFSEGK